MGKFREVYPDPLISPGIDEFLKTYEFTKGVPESIDFKRKVGYTKTFVTEKENLAHIHVSSDKIRVFVEEPNGKELYIDSNVLENKHKEHVFMFEELLDSLFDYLEIKKPLNCYTKI